MKIVDFRLKISQFQCRQSSPAFLVIMLLNASAEVQYQSRGSVIVSVTWQTIAARV